MDFGIRGKVAMVAAASKGIGLAAAKLLAQEGCQVSICARNEETLEAAAAEIGGETRSYCVDVSDADDLAWWVDQTKTDLGPPDILVTNTGGPPAGSFTQMSDDDWHRGFESTLMNVVRLVRLVAPSMQAKGSGRIVHLTSLVAHEPSNVLPISSTLRSGMLALAKLQSNELAPRGITVNCVLPGHTLTDRQRHLAEIRAGKEGISPEEALLKQGSESPVGRLATPEEIGAAVVFLCSQQAAYITGTSILVDGGVVKGY